MNKFRWTRIAIYCSLATLFLSILPLQASLSVSETKSAANFTEFHGFGAFSFLDVFAVGAFHNVDPRFDLVVFFTYVPGSSPLRLTPFLILVDDRAAGNVFGDCFKPAAVVRVRDKDLDVSIEKNNSKYIVYAKVPYVPKIPFGIIPIGETGLLLRRARLREVYFNDLSGVVATFESPWAYSNFVLLWPSSIFPSPESIVMPSLNIIVSQATEYFRGVAEAFNMVKEPAIQKGEDPEKLAFESILADTLWGSITDAQRGNIVQSIEKIRANIGQMEYSRSELLDEFSQIIQQLYISVRKLVETVAGNSGPVNRARIERLIKQADSYYSQGLYSSAFSILINGYRIGTSGS